MASVSHLKGALSENRARADSNLVGTSEPCNNLYFQPSELKFVLTLILVKEKTLGRTVDCLTVCER